jgi:arylsulfatase
METWPDCGTTPFRGAKGNTYEGGVRVPGIAYWKGVIAPGRISDGLFHLSDLFTTALSLAGAKESIPKDRYIDGIDQASFLLSDKGESNRKAVFYWLMTYPSAIRIAEYKLTVVSESDDDRDVSNIGGFGGEYQFHVAPRFYNLYLDPKEMHSYFIRKLTYENVLRDALKEHLATFKKYPPKHPIGQPIM